MAYVLVQDGVVVQKQQSPEEGFIEAPDSVVCGFLYDGSEFTLPPPSQASLAEENAAALAERRRDETKDEILELAEKGDVASLASALKKALELIT